MVMRISFFYKWVYIRYKNNNEWWFIRKKYKPIELERLVKKKQSVIYSSEHNKIQLCPSYGRSFPVTKFKSY